MPVTKDLSRREFLKRASLSVAALSAVGNILVMETKGDEEKKAIVSLVKTEDREHGIKESIRLLALGDRFQNKQVLIKPNFNTADPFPASTHNDTLAQIILELKDLGAKEITIGERSGPVNTSEVLSEKGIYELAQNLGVGLINFEEADWVRVQPSSSHWSGGFRIAKPILDAETIVSTCCLKTHAYGGVFTMSLKLSVGIVHKGHMNYLHSSPNMRQMIAEINQVYAPALIVLDGLVAFVDGGPAYGTAKTANVILAGDDRIAIDALGLAVLKDLGSNKAIMGRKIFEQEQIARAVELGLGVQSPKQIEIITSDAESRAYADRLLQILRSEA